MQSSTTWASPAPEKPYRQDDLFELPLSPIGYLPFINAHAIVLHLWPDALSV